MARTVSGKSPLSYVGIKEKQPPENYFIDRAPTTSDTSFDEGDIWIDRTNEKAYILVKKVGAVATWSQIGTSTEELSSLTCDSGIATPVANTITCTGNNGLQTLGAAGSLTYLFSPVTAGYTGSQREYRQSAIQTTDATPTDIVSVSLAEGEMISIEARINAYKSDFTESLVARVFTGARRGTGGNVVIINSNLDIFEDSAGAPTVTVNADVGNQKIDIRFVGEAAKEYNVVCSYEYHKTLTNA